MKLDRPDAISTLHRINQHSRSTAEMVGQTVTLLSADGQRVEATIYGIGRDHTGELNSVSLIFDLNGSQHFEEIPFRPEDVASASQFAVAV